MTSPNTPARPALRAGAVPFHRRFLSEEVKSILAIARRTGRCETRAAREGEINTFRTILYRFKRNCLAFFSAPPSAATEAERLWLAQTIAPGVTPEWLQLVTTRVASHPDGSKSLIVEERLPLVPLATHSVANLSQDDLDLIDLANQDHIPGG